MVLPSLRGFMVRGSMLVMREKYRFFSGKIGFRPHFNHPCLMVIRIGILPNSIPDSYFTAEKMVFEEL
jgi:hypothetical protein